MSVEYDDWQSIDGYKNEWCKENCDHYVDCEERPCLCGLVGDYCD